MPTNPHHQPLPLPLPDLFAPGLRPGDLDKLAAHGQLP